MPDRNVVKKFFEYKLDNKQVNKSTVNLTAILIFALIVTSAGTILEAPQLLSFVFFTIIILGLLCNNLERNKQEFEKLVEQVRIIQGNDLSDAFFRIFKRTRIDRNRLRIVEKNYSGLVEKKLLSEEILKEKLGDLQYKTIRFYSHGDLSKTNFRFVKLSEMKTYDVFFNPIRLIVLFLTETQLVIGDIQFDSLKGNLNYEKIQRISFSKIVNIYFIVKPTLMDWSAEEVVQTATNLGHSEDKINEIRKDINENGNTNWSVKKITSQLIITRTDSGELKLPIRTEYFFGKYVKTFDKKTPLTKDEINVDRMINELNRHVEQAK